MDIAWHMENLQRCRQRLVRMTLQKQWMAIEIAQLRENGCTQTLKQMKNWWQVDLQAVYVIKEVAITNRGDRNGELKCATDTGFDNGVQLKDGMMILK